MGFNFLCGVYIFNVNMIFMVFPKIIGEMEIIKLLGFKSLF